MNDLTRYVFFNYKGLMTKTEYAAFMFFVLEGKIAHASSPAEAARMRAEWPHWLPPSDEAAVLLRGGWESFQEAVCARILREQSDDVFLNRCPRCGTLARTPRARQCPQCFHSWRDAV